MSDSSGPTEEEIQQGYRDADAALAELAEQAEAKRHPGKGSGDESNLVHSRRR